MVQSKPSVQGVGPAWWVHAMFLVLKLLLVTGIVAVLAGVVIPDAAREFGG